MATARPRAVGRPSANAGNSASSASDVYYRDHHILTEYRQLREHAPPGVYVVPSERSLLVWEGLICVRQSFYAGGMFRFELRLAEKHPREPPQLRFLSDVFHPQVGELGRVDLSRVLRDKDFLISALRYVYHMFYEISLENPANPAVAACFAKLPEQFRLKAAECAQQATQRVIHESAHAPAAAKPSSLKLGPPAPQHEQAVQLLVQTYAETGENYRATMQRMKEFFAEQHQKRPAS